MTRMQAATRNGMVLIYDTDDVENIHVATPHDVIDITRLSDTARRQELGQAHLDLHIDFKPGTKPLWVKAETADSSNEHGKISTPGLPPDSLVAFVEACLNIDNETIVNLTGPPPITREIYDAGWDRYAIFWDLAAKRGILKAYQEARSALASLEQQPAAASEIEAAVTCARALEAGRALMAIAATYRDRYGYGRAIHGQWTKDLWRD